PKRPSPPRRSGAGDASGSWMIEQILNQEFLLDVSAGLRAHAEATLGKAAARARGPLAKIEDEERTAFSAALAAADGAPHAPGAGPLPPKDDLVFIPHDPLLSIVQSAAEEAAAEHQPEAIEAPSGALHLDRRRKAPAVTNERLRDVERR